MTRLVASLLLLLSAFRLGAAEPAVDQFEQIARQKEAAVPGLAPNPAPRLPDVALPWDPTPGAGFRPVPKIETQEQLQAELQRMREKYAPFLADLAPALPPLRRQTALDRFEWRLISSEMEEDGQGNLRPLPAPRPVPEPNPWREVAIPHYVGPINKAEACYRRELEITPEQLAADRLFLHFNGVDYVAEVFVNGQKAGSHEGLFGAFEFDIKPLVSAGRNRLEIRVFNDSPMMGDNFFLANRKFGRKIAACGGPGWDEPGLARGWHMCPVGFGLWQRCYLETRSAAYVRDLCVRPQLDQSRAVVEVEVPAEAKDFALRWSLYGQNFPATVAVGQAPAGLTTSEAPGAPGFRRLQFTVAIPKEQLRPWSLEEPWLYQLQVEIVRDGQAVDAAKRQFGMRSFVQSATSTPKGRFYLNGEEIKLRGANTMGNLMQCVIRKDFGQLRDDILLAKIANLTYWRLTQQPCQEEVYDYFDRLGLLAQTDLPLFVNIRNDQAEECHRQLGEMVRLVRGHPANALISYMNEPGSRAASLGNAAVVAAFRRWDDSVRDLNPDQVVKWVDGDYQNLSQGYSDHHVYDTWYGNGIRSEYFGGWHATREGWMHGCGEFGAEGLDSLALMAKYYPPAWREPDAAGHWSPKAIPRCQTPTTGAKWFQPTPDTQEEWIARSRDHQRWATRLFAESLRRDPKMNSFAIHLLVDAWPAGWLKAVVDCDRQAKPAYFAYRDALAPLAVNLRPDAFYGFSGRPLKVGVWICNDTPKVPAGALLRYQLEAEGKILCTGSAKANVAASAPEFQGWLEIACPQVEVRQPATLRVGLFSAAGLPLHDSAVDLEIFPAASQGQKLDRPGGQAQRLISH